MAELTHYQVLGCKPTATKKELRAAYLELARVHHPDRHAEDSQANKAAAANKMRQVNAAWSVLSNTRKRQRYDQTLKYKAGASNTGAPTGGTASSRGAAEGNVRDTWHAFDEYEDFDPDELDDRPYEGSRSMSPGVTVAPIFLLLFAAAFLGAALLFNANFLVAIAAVLASLGVVGFFVVPLLALTRSKRDPTLD